MGELVCSIYASSAFFSASSRFFMKTALLHSYSVALQNVTSMALGCPPATMAHSGSLRSGSRVSSLEALNTFFVVVADSWLYMSPVPAHSALLLRLQYVQYLSLGAGMSSPCC